MGTQGGRCRSDGVDGSSSEPASRTKVRRSVIANGADCALRGALAVNSPNEHSCPTIAVECRRDVGSEKIFLDTSKRTPCRPEMPSASSTRCSLQVRYKWCRSSAARRLPLAGSASASPSWTPIWRDLAYDAREWAFL
jgi:hypothetical protein